MTIRQKPAALLALLPLLLCASPAEAVQAHGGAEGLVAHQLGHLLFFSGIIFLLAKIHRERVSGPGWGLFRGFLWLLIVWNCVTFPGHWMHEHIDPGKFVRTGGVVTGFVVSDLFDAVFYLTRLDHLFLVPAFLFLVLALDRWEKKS
ncbi:MAG: hypothetical protein Kow0089_24370 [Desulfobulbaceae bacterium]